MNLKILGKFNKYSGLAAKLVLVMTFSLISPAKDANAQNLALLVGFKPFTDLTNPTKLAVLDEEPPTKDELAVRIDTYFKKRNMPLEGYGSEFVEAAQKCDLDWRLLPAIGVRESSGGKFDRNNNPFGWGSARIKFTDYSDAIDQVSDHLCGLVPSTERYYKNKNTSQILWHYNGTVLKTYPREVMEIMDMI